MTLHKQNFSQIKIILTKTLSSSLNPLLRTQNQNNMNSNSRITFLKHVFRAHVSTATSKLSTYGNVHHAQSTARHYSKLPPPFRKFRDSLDIGSPSLLISQFSSSLKTKSGFGFVDWYLDMVKARPFLTKSVTCSIIYTAADFSSQTLSRKSSEPYDYWRTLRMAGYGMIVLGPTLNLWFNFMSKLFPKQDLASTFKKMVMGQTVYGPVMTVVFLSMNAGLQGETGTEIVSRLKRDLLPTLINGVMYWPMCDFITFRFFPVHLQPLVSNSFSYLWTIYMTYMASLEKAGTSPS